MTDRVLARALTAVESHELPLLSWGIVDGSFTQDEILTLLEAAEPTTDPEDLLDDLVDQGLIVEQGLTNTRYRTRMAETVRLAAGLRQWFHGKDWRTAKPLVSDIRFLSRPRLVPRRDISSDSLIESIDEQTDRPLSDQRREILRSLLGGRQVSAFQARSTLRMLGTAGRDINRGTCITAGTGSGKTLAFYLGALSDLAATPGSATPRLIALYPRTELLRDQLKNLLKSLDALRSSTGISLHLGVLYGACPGNRHHAETQNYLGWKQRDGGLECPIVDCLEADCDGKLLWPQGAGEDQILVCESCDTKVTSLVFTRDHLESQPPEILFTTTEMLNRNLGSGSMPRILVGDQDSGPAFLLLDEIHTYSGVHGAQVANLLRRWRNRLRHPVHIVGLSATLADPLGFFSGLTGLSTAQMVIVTPVDTELEEVGREYFLALRGDPASQASLLSTTIQTSMLLRRMLDPTLGQPSGGTFGSRLFVFTDKIDVVNRLHTQLEDAEGWQPGGVNRKPTGSLAMLRAPGRDDTARDAVGQLWSFAHHPLGTLGRDVKVGRTTSKDKGVEISDDIVVATASLEVGFDDPQVGAVLQHKAPREAAQFLQRRGRAGRDPLMRPWAVIVLSDYGRDRLAFQAYETLFDPVVLPSNLPIRNRVVLKMQATWWLLDRLARHTGNTRLRDVMLQRWRTNRDGQRSRAARAATEARKMISQSGIEQLTTSLRYALSIDEEDVRSILWDHPRAIVTSVIPTLIRRLEAMASTQPLPDGYRRTDPIAEFVPHALFQDLQIPEVRLTAPFNLDAATDQGVTEPIGQAMREYAPGSVSYRHALRGARQRLWLPPPTDIDEVLRVEDFCADYVDLPLPPDDPQTRLIQPRELSLDRPPPGMTDSASGTWLWTGAFHVETSALDLDRPLAGDWADRILGLRAMTHRHRCPLTVWRYAREFDLDYRIAPNPSATRHRVTLKGESVGLGFSSDVDAVAFNVRLPEPNILNDRTVPGLWESMRVAHLEHRFRSDELLMQRIPSSFLRGWILQLVVSVVAIKASGRPVTETYEELTPEKLGDSILDAARDVFGAPDPAGNDPDRHLVDEIRSAISDIDVLGRVHELARELGEEPTADWLPWIQDRYLATLTAALTEAIQSLCPDVDAESLLPDVTKPSGEDAPESAQIWISENQPGGMGVIEAFVKEYVEDPRTFWALVSAALEPCAGERVDRTLQSFLADSGTEPLASALKRVRSATDLETLTAAWSQLRQVMFEEGLDADPSITTAMATRFLRPGSDQGLADLTHQLLKQWNRIETGLGFEVDLRVFAYLAVQDPVLRQQVLVQTGGGPNRAEWLIGQVVGLLWTRGRTVREASLQNYNPFAELEPTERLLLADVGVDRRDPVLASEGSWRIDADERLRASGSCVLRCTDKQTVAATLRNLLTEPTTSGVLELHPRLVGLRRSGRGWDVQIELREAHQ